MDGVDGREKNAAPQVATITAGVVIIGDVECQGDFQIAGRVQGDVRAPTVFVDEGGVVTGGIYAERVRVSGSVDGSIEAGDLAVEPGGRVSGTINYTRLKVSAGGIVAGQLSHREGDGPAAREGNIKLVDTADHLNPRRVYVD